MSEFILPESATIVDPITTSECTSLGNNTGLNIDDGETTCQALSSRLMPLLAQIVSDISSGKMTIYANDDSKCSAEDESPTLASMMSRIYRVSEAFTCILCTYDPTLSNLLTSGSYPQVLLGKQSGSNYPHWSTPDSTPTASSSNLVTSNGVYQAIRNAILSVWHLWEKGDNGNFQYLETSLGALPLTGNTDGDYAIVYSTQTHVNTIYQWSDDDDAWNVSETIQPSAIEDFAVIHVEKGTWEDKGLYWFQTSWNIMDADIRELEQRVSALETSMLTVVQALDTSSVYEIGVVNTYAQASAITAESGKIKIAFIRS